MTHQDQTVDRQKHGDIEVADVCRSRPTVTLGDVRAEVEVDLELADLVVETLIWRPYLPEPQPACVEPGESDPVPLDVLVRARDLCANFPVPPRQFRTRTARGCCGSYYPRSDIVAVDPIRSAWDGMGGDEGYYAMLIHELLHATGHSKRLARATTGDFSREGYGLEEGTVITAQRIVLQEIGFGAEAIDWFTPQGHGLPVDTREARKAAAWMLGGSKTSTARATSERANDLTENEQAVAFQTFDSSDLCRPW